MERNLTSVQLCGLGLEIPVKASPREHGLYIPGNKLARLIEVLDFIRQGFCGGRGKLHGESVERET